MTDLTTNINVTEQTVHMLVATIADGAGAACVMPKGTSDHVFAATIAGTGTVSATVTIEGSIDGGVTWVPALATMSLTGTTTDKKTATITGAPWPQLRARTASTTGTGATVDVWMGI